MALSRSPEKPPGDRPIAGVNPPDPVGRLLFNVLAMVAEFASELAGRKPGSTECTATA
ncbi:hypothetical protein ADILRU_0197 [Leifsonia rubra CMS 76R]|nr:hypothetical protein ADILRU_0197 [Leifsonia rubra CMS 76R]